MHSRAPRARESANCSPTDGAASAVVTPIIPTTTISSKSENPGGRRSCVLLRASRIIGPTREIIVQLPFPLAFSAFRLFFALPAYVNDAIIPHQMQRSAFFPSEFRLK